MNTVTDLRKVLSEEMNRLQPPDGLEARVFQGALRSSAAVDRTRHARRRGVIRPRLSEPVAAPRLMALIAALLAVLIVVSLVLAARALYSKSIVPVRPGPPPTTHRANGLIAVSANPKDVGGGEVGDIYLVREGAPARRIVGSDGDGVAQACPRFSPDGRWLAYGEARASAPVTTFRGVWPVSNRAVVVVGINGDGDTTQAIMRVALPRDPGQIACPEWSPTGTQLAFRVGAGLWVEEVSSGKTTTFTVTQAPWGQQYFAWSRDGSLIAVAEPGRIRVVRIPGGASTLIPVKGGGTTPGSLGWTAGDDRIIYISTDAPGDGLAVNVVAANGNNDTQLTPDSADVQVRFYYTVVSPDGTRVAYVQRTTLCSSNGCIGLPERLLVIGTDGANVAELQIPPGFRVSGLQWSPDGERLLFGSIAGVVSIAVTPGSPAVVYSSGELNLEWSGSEVTWQPVFP